MEKFSLGKSIGKNIKKIAVVAGLSSLSMLPNNKAENSLKADDMFFNSKDKIENNIEFNKNDLEFNKKYVEEVAFLLIKQFVEKVNFQELILGDELEIQKLYEELNFRKLFSKPSGQYTYSSDKEILEDIKYFETNIKDLKDLLYYLNLGNLERSNVKMPDYIKYNIESKIIDINKIVSYYDIGRQWILNNLYNQKYKEKLKKEEEQELQNKFSNDELKKYLEEEYSLRMKQISNTNYIISNNIQESYNDAIQESYSDKKYNVKAFYNFNKKEIYLPLENDSLEAITNAIHEFSHKITECEVFLSEKAIKLFSDSFDSLSVAANLSNKEEKESKNFLESISYFSDPTEMYARKKSFEYDLERLGIKRYEEKFTLKHYLRALKLKKEGKLSSDSKEFLNIIKPEMIEKVMNEIADIDYKQKQTENMV